MRYVYKARSIRNNKVFKGQVTYESEYEVKQYLASKEMIPLRIQPKNFFNTEIEHFPIFQQTISLNDMALFCRQFAVIIETGISVGTALELTGKACKNRTLKLRIDQVYRQVVRGKGLAEAMTEVEGFPFLLVSMIETGEVIGRMDEILYEMADYFENQMAIRKKMQRAMIYPAIILSVLAVAVWIVMTGVIPSYIMMFEEMEVILPSSTQIIMNLSDWFNKYWEIMLIICGLFIAFITYFIRTKPGEKYLDIFILWLPGIGYITKQILTARWTSSVALGIKAGIPILQTLENSKKIMNNTVVTEELEVIIQGIRKGQSLGEALGISQIFPELMVSMISIGEETGTLDIMLLKVGAYTQSQLTNTIDKLIVLIEPTLTVFIAILVGFMMFAIVAPTFTLATELM